MVVTPCRFDSGRRYHIRSTGSVIFIFMPNKVVKTSHCGNVVVYERDTTKVLYARMKLGKAWKAFSTKKKDREEAFVYAYDRYKEELVLRKHGKSTFDLKKEKTFAKLADDVADMLIKRSDTPAAQSDDRQYGLILRQLVVDCESLDIPIAQVDGDALEDFYEDCKIKHGGDYAKSTLLKHNIALKKVFEKAAKDKSIKFSEHQIPRLTTKGKGLRPKRRPPFLDNEIVELFKKDEDWITAAPKKLSRYKRSIMFFYMDFIYKTGVRPGEETLQLKYRDFDAIQNHLGNDVVYVNLESSKIDKEEGRAIYIEGHHYMDTLVRLNEMKRIFITDFMPRPESLIFCDLEGNALVDMEAIFREYLIHKKLRCNARFKNRNRTLYSLRHTYATNQRRKGQDLELLAQAMGTSPEMLREYYIHFNLDEVFATMFYQERVHHNEMIQRLASTVTSGKRHREEQRKKKTRINKVYE